MKTTSDKNRLEAIKKEFSQGFIAHIGYELMDISDGVAVSRLDVRHNHLQQDGFIHAGVLSAMADHTAGFAAFTLIPEEKRILTIEFKINFLRPAAANQIICRAKVLKAGKNILVCESEVFDVREEAEVLTAKAQLTMAAVSAADLTARPPA